MNAQEAIHHLENVVGALSDPIGISDTTFEAIATLSATLDEREKLRSACLSIKRQGDPYTATQDWPDPASFASWAIEQVSNALKSSGDVRPLMGKEE